MPNGERIEGCFAAFNTVLKKEGLCFFAGVYLYPEKPSLQEIAQKKQMFLQTHENMIRLIESGQIDSIYDQLHKY